MAIHVRGFCVSPRPDVDVVPRPAPGAPVVPEAVRPSPCGLVLPLPSGGFEVQVPENVHPQVDRAGAPLQGLIPEQVLSGRLPATIPTVPRLIL